MNWLFALTLFVFTVHVLSFNLPVNRWCRLPSKPLRMSTTNVGYRDDLRNVAIIAHVDHGKTTLVDSMIRQSGSFRNNQEIASMDSNDQEKERGITILAKNAAIMYKNTKINIVDTPGHADFGGEVERIMNMVDGVLLVVDSVDGPKPQTKFVLRKALERGVRAIVVVNKVDRPQARPEYVVNQVFDLFTELNASDEQLDFQIVYASGLKGMAGLQPDAIQDNLNDLFDEILKLPKASVDETQPLQLLVANIDYDEFKGKLCIGRIVNGVIREDEYILYGKPLDTITSTTFAASPPTDEAIAAAASEVADAAAHAAAVAATTAASLASSETSATTEESTTVSTTPTASGYKKGKIAELFVFNSMGKEAVTAAYAGDIVMVAGISDISIGDTIMSKETPLPLPPIKVEEPTVRMSIGVNKSPLAGREGKLLQSRVIRDRLYKELEKNVALKVFSTESSDTYEICGRGQLHLTVLIETMRREGFEVMVGPPTVIEKVIDGVKHEPFEAVEVTVPNEYSSAIVDIVNKRKGEMQLMGPCEGSDGYTAFRFLVPTRGMIGIRSALLTATKGTVVLDTVFDSYRPYAGNIGQREKGSLIATETNIACSYGLDSAQERGRLFVQPKDEIYKDMIVGIHQRPGDLAINVCKTKHLTNMRSAGNDDNVKLIPPVELNLDIAVEYIQDDELVEVTPTKIRMCKHPNFKDMFKRRKDLDK